MVTPTTTSRLFDLPEALSLPACKPTFYIREDVWRFPCGLRVSAALPTAPGFLYGPMYEIHERHHAHCAPRDYWAFMETLETGPDWAKITVRCDCTFQDGGAP